LELTRTVAGTALAEAHAAGIGVIVKEALANGRLTGRNSELSFAPKLSILQTAARKLEISVDALVLAAVLTQPFADVVLSGATSAEQILSNAKACRVHPDQDTMALLLRLAEPPETYWTTRSKLPWN
jgi:aryl-alcohol dehydrogenase-like predicted oxidoreductase